jgi:hypothetical protein
MICKACSNSFETKFCPACGSAAAVKRIDRHYVVHELQHDIIHLEKGFLFTVKELTLRPGTAVRNFLGGNRSRYYKPIGFLIVCSVIYTVISHWIGKPPIPASGNGNMDKINHWVEAHYSYANLIEILLIALSLHWFFGRKGYNYFEHLVLMSYLTGYGMLVGTVLMLFSRATGVASSDSIFLFFVLLYTVWAVGMFYKAKSWLVYGRALLAYITGFMLFVLLAIVVGVILELLGIHL